MGHKFCQPELRMKGSVLLTFLLLAFAIPAPVSSQNSQVRGTVYLDVNENGIRDPREKGIGGVKVSNGVEVVKTNARGQYEIVLSPESTLFISKPADYRLPLNEVQLPQFYFHYYPDGTPAVAAWKWAGNRTDGLTAGDH